MPSMIFGVCGDSEATYHTWLLASELIVSCGCLGIQKHRENNALFSLRRWNSVMGQVVLGLDLGSLFISCDILVKSQCPHLGIKIALTS